MIHKHAALGQPIRRGACTKPAESCMRVPDLGRKLKRLKRQAGFRVPIFEEIEHYTQTSEPKAFGEGTGILVVAKSELGCLLGGSALGKKGTPAEQIGINAAQELVEDLNCGGCLDRW